jgi:hypothetical protein
MHFMPYLLLLLIVSLNHILAFVQEPHLTTRVRLFGRGQLFFEHVVNISKRRSLFPLPLFLYVLPSNSLV